VTTARLPRHLLNRGYKTVGGQMSVTKNHGNIGVAQKLANRIEIHTRLNQAACKMMPQVMESEIDDFSLFDNCAPGFVDVS
jgi:hypothetical protein